jgi:hypothetical protein
VNNKQENTTLGHSSSSSALLPPCLFGFDFDPATPLAASGAAAGGDMNTSLITGADLPRNLPILVLC